MIDQGRLSALAQSLGENGQVAPIVVRRVPGREHYLIVCGERRWLAASGDPRARTIRCEVYDDLSEERALVLRLTDALTREAFHAIELGEMMARLKKLLGCSIRGLARPEDLGGRRAAAAGPAQVAAGGPGHVEARRTEVVARPGDRQGPRRESGFDRDAGCTRGLTFEQKAALVRQCREAAGMASRGQRRWQFRGPGGYKIVITGPPDSSRSDLGRVLSRVLARVLARRSPRGTPSAW